jgi:hypothetical protein
MRFEDKNLFSIDPEHIRRVRLVAGVVFLTLAVMDFMSPNSASLSTGRWSWLYRMVTEAFGPYGYVILEAIVGLAFIAWSRCKSSKP